MRQKKSKENKEGNEEVKKKEIYDAKKNLSSFEQWDEMKVYFSFIVFPSCSLHTLTSSYGWPLLLSLQSKEEKKHMQKQ